MTARHVEFLVEEPSMEAFLRALLPRLLPPDRSFDVRVFQGKPDLLRKLENRLRGYAKWLPEDHRIVVMVDRDNDECHALKVQLEETAGRAGLLTRSRAAGRPWQLVNRVVIEELEAWYFGDWDAVRAAYPRVSATIPNKAPYRVPDAIVGRDLGSVRANLETAQLLHDRTAQGGSGASHRHSHRSGPQSFAELRPIRRRHCRGKRLKEQLTSHPSEVIPKPPRRRG